MWIDLKLPSGTLWDDHTIANCKLQDVSTLYKNQIPTTAQVRELWNYIKAEYKRKSSTSDIPYYEMHRYLLNITGRKYLHTNSVIYIYIPCLDEFKETLLLAVFQYSSLSYIRPGKIAMQYIYPVLLVKKSLTLLDLKFNDKITINES